MSPALGGAAGSDCWGSPTIPWGGLGLYGTGGVLEVVEMHAASGYPTRFVLNGAEQAIDLAAHRYLQGGHLGLEEPHLYADILYLVKAILEERAPRVSGEQARHVVDIIEKSRLAAETSQAQPLASTFEWGGG